MQKGTVKFFDDRKGWGFIKPEEGDDVYVHYSGIQGEGQTRKTLDEKQEVEFEIGVGPDGRPQAIKVVKV